MKSIGLPLRQAQKLRDLANRRETGGGPTPSPPPRIVSNQVDYLLITADNGDGTYDATIQRWDEVAEEWEEHGDTTVIPPDGETLTVAEYCLGIRYSDAMYVATPSSGGVDGTAYVRITSETQTAGRYPGKLLVHNVVADTWSDGATIWVDEVHQEELELDKRYLAQLTGTVSGVAVYVAKACCCMGLDGGTFFAPPVSEGNQSLLTLVESGSLWTYGLTDYYYPAVPTFRADMDFFDNFTGDMGVQIHTALPAGATVVGLEIEVTVRDTGGANVASANTRDDDVYLFDSGTSAGGPNVAQAGLYPVGSSGVAETRTYGSSTSSTWGIPLTAAKLNSGDLYFHFSSLHSPQSIFRTAEPVIRVTAVTVYYTEDTPQPEPEPGMCRASLQINRGDEEELPSLSHGEPALTTTTGGEYELWIGTPDGNEFLVGTGPHPVSHGGTGLSAAPANTVLAGDGSAWFAATEIDGGSF